MIIMADANLLISLVDNRSDYRIFSQYFERNEAILALPTPAVAEFLVMDENYKRSDFLTISSNFCQIFDLDMKSARMTANIFRDLLKKGYFKHKKGDKQKVKVDIQIIGMTLANQIPKIFTGDKEIEDIIKLLNLPIEAIDIKKNNEFFDLPLFNNYK
ncbi:PIN domain-containing protein [Psychrobacter urativorans]|uniref:PIN domain-containing protein n=1 Tax=Psychrobacter urativorans TaxID=45610 RepID=UPI00191B292A|nr:PIN domain-containing protein [Psychrobacter urativorans]